MFFIFGLFLGLIGGAVAMLAWGCPLLILRSLRLLTGDARIWWLLSAAPAFFTGRYFLLATHKHQIPKEQLARGFYYYQFTGMVMGVALVCLMGLLLAWLMRTRLGQPSMGTAAYGISVVCLLVMSVGSWRLYVGPAATVAHNEQQQKEFIAALLAEDLAEVERQLQSGYRLRSAAPELDAQTPVVFAIRRQNIPLMALLLAPPGGKPSANPAHLAEEVLATGNRAMLDRLLEIVGPLRQQVLDNGLKHAVISGNQAAFDDLLNRGANLAGGEQEHWTLLMYAALHGRSAIADELIARGVDVNALNPMPSAYFGSTALIMAAQKGHTELARRLIMAGADVNLTSPPEQTALIAACRARSPETVALLLTEGARVEPGDRQQRTALHAAVAQTAAAKTPEELAAVEAIIAALLDAGADPTAADRAGKTPRDKGADLPLSEAIKARLLAPGGDS